MSGDSRLGDVDLHLFGEGKHYRLYDKLGAHPGVRDGVAGTTFAVWAPNAGRVSVIGDFNEWRHGVSPLAPRARSAPSQSSASRATYASHTSRRSTMFANLPSRTISIKPAVSSSFR